MADIAQEEAVTITVNMSNKKKELLSTAMKRTSEWFTSYLWCYLTYLSKFYLRLLNLTLVFIS